MKYDDRIQRSVDYIDQHLMEDLNLEELAAQSGYSLSNFYRIFEAVTGFSLKEFVRNKRLAAAARELVFTRRRILDIALDCGFNSQEVFTRAFVSLYGITPGEFRQTRKDSIEAFERADTSARLMEERSRRTPLEIPIQAEIIQRGWMHLVGMEIRTGVAENIDTLCIPRFWEETFIPRIREIPHRSNPYVAVAYEVGTPLDDSLLHMACVEVTQPEPPAGMLARSLEPGWYAAFTPPRQLDPYEYSALVRYAYGEWFPMSGCNLRADYTLDLYITTRSHDGQRTSSNLSVLIPIHPKEKPSALSSQPSVRKRGRQVE